MKKKFMLYLMKEKTPQLLKGVILGLATLLAHIAIIAALSHETKLQCIRSLDFICFA